MGQLCTNLALNSEARPTLLDLLGVCPQLLLYVYGDSSDGGTTPDATAQASIDGLRALGVPAANIKWTYIVDKNLTVANLTGASTIGGITLALAGGLLIISNPSSASSIGEITLALAGGALSVASSTSASTIEEITLALAGGLLVVASASSDSTIDLITLTQN